MAGASAAILRPSSSTAALPNRCHFASDAGGALVAAVEPICGNASGSGSFHCSNSHASLVAIQIRSAATNASASGTSPADIENQATSGTLVLAVVKSTGGDASQLGAAIQHGRGWFRGEAVLVQIGRD